MTRRQGASLASVMILLLAAASIFTWLFLILSWSQESLTAVAVRSRDRAELTSQIAVCRRWIQGELAAGRPPRLSSGPGSGGLNALRVFVAHGPDGALAAVHDLNYAFENPAAPGGALPSCPMGLLIRAETGRSSSNFVIELVLMTRDVLLPDGSVVTVLDERPLIWREIWL